MANRTIYIARHGETEWNRVGRWQGHTDIPLSGTGRSQALELARAVRDRGISFVGSSDLARALETATIVAAALALPPVTLADAGLRERGFGCFEGLTRAECEARYPEEWGRYRSDARLRPPGGEPTERVVTRMRLAVVRASRLVSDEGAGLLVSHGGAIRALVNAVTGELPPPLPNGALFRLTIAENDSGSRFAEVEQLF